jgi:hypothetical protein
MKKFIIGQCWAYLIKIKLKCNYSEEIDIVKTVDIFADPDKTAQAV